MMVDALRLYLRYISISLRGQMQYKASFIMLSIGTFIGTGIEFLGVWALFDRFGNVKGWTLPEIALFYGLINMAFSLSDAVSRGFDLFGNLVKSGDFDRLLLRPRSTALQLAGQELTLRRIGRFSQGLVALLWSSGALGLSWSLPRLALACATVLGGACLFYALIVLQATLAFWTTEGLEIVNSVTYGGVQTAHYPLSIYRDGFRRFFTFVIPLACVSYYPILAILGRPDPWGVPAWFGWVAPAIGLLFFALGTALGSNALGTALGSNALALQLWELGVRHYTSTGS